MRPSIVVLVAGFAGLTACRDGRSHGVTTPNVGDYRAPTTLVDAPDAFASAGCAIGQADGGGINRVQSVSREEMPIRLPEMRRVPAVKKGRAVFYTKRVGISMPGTQQPVVIACIVPVGGPQGDLIEAALKRVPQNEWLRLSEKLSRESQVQGGSISSALETTLRHAVAAKEETHGHRTRPNYLFSGPPTLGTITVTAGYNYGWWSMSSVMSFLRGISGEPGGWSSERVVWYEGWSRLCDEYNEAYWDWYYSRESAIAAADAEIPYYEEQKAAVTTAAASLHNYACEPVEGKRICLDFFIGQCNVGPVLGDCRGFDSAATFSQSRFHIYVNPDEQAWEMKFGGTKIAFSTCGWLAACAPGVISFGDSTHAAEGVRIVPQSFGAFDVEVAIRTPACFWGGFACPSINQSYRFTPDASEVGGFRVTGFGNTSPSVGVYNYNGSVYNTMRAFPQKSYSMIGFIQGLIDAYNYQKLLPPPDNPNGCALY